MKCLKNVSSGKIVRVDDKQANQMVGNIWKYVSKNEWRKINQPKKEETEYGHDMGGSYEVKKEKKKTSKKVK